MYDSDNEDTHISATLRPIIRDKWQKNVEQVYENDSEHTFSSANFWPIQWYERSKIELRHYMVQNVKIAKWESVW